MLNLKELESSASGTTFDLDSILGALKFNQDGLIPAVAQDIDTRGTHAGLDGCKSN